MLGFGGELAEECLDFGGCDGRQACARFARDPLGHGRACRDGGGAAADTIARFCDAVAFEAGRKPEDIAARWIFDFDGYRRRREFADIARIAEVIEQRFGEHASSIILKQL